jgi:hypothetical protein
MVNPQLRFTCDWIFKGLVVLCDGKVVCGCGDPYGERPLGNFREQSLMEIWNSEKARKIREDLNSGFSSFCQECGLKKYVSDKEHIPQRDVQPSLTRLFFEPTVLCNLSCYHAVCGKESGIVKTRERAMFSFDEFQSLMDQCAHGLVRLDFFNYGESFIHPQAVEMIEYIKQKFPQIYLYVSTNGLLFDQDKIRRIVNAGLDEITFSIDGSDQDTYRKYRVGGDIKVALTNLKTFVQERNRIGREVPFINWRYILFAWNDSRKQMMQARKRAEEIGIDRLTWEITDHPLDALSRKYQRGTKHWRRIVHEIWDTSELANAISDKKYIAELKIKLRVIEVLAGASTSIEVIVKNKGGAEWLRSTFSGRRIIRLGAQLYDRNKTLIDRDFARAFIPTTMKKNGKSKVILELLPISIPGAYWLKFDMVSEGIAWFETAGSPVVWKEIHVR